MRANDGKSLGCHCRQINRLVSNSISGKYEDIYLSMTRFGKQIIKIYKLNERHYKSDSYCSYKPSSEINGEEIITVVRKKCSQIQLNAS